MRHGVPDDGVACRTALVDSSLAPSAPSGQNGQPFLAVLRGVHTSCGLFSNYNGSQVPGFSSFVEHESDVVSSSSIGDWI
jgi:hypothetical protein